MHEQNLNWIFFQSLVRIGPMALLVAAFAVPLRREVLAFDRPSST